MLRDRIIETVQGFDLEIPVQRVQLGLIYSAVQLADGSAGVAFSFPRTGCGLELEGEEPLIGRPAADLIHHLGSHSLPASSVALAAINALVTSQSSYGIENEGDILEYLDIHAGDQICMVGCFLPVMDKLEKRDVDVVAVDQVPKAGAEPPERSAVLLPQSQIAIITATAIINGTIGPLLESAANCREVAILGPSTPLLAEAFQDTPVSCLSGIRIDQPDPLFQAIAEGRGFRVFKRYVTKVNRRIKTPGPSRP